MNCHPPCISCRYTYSNSQFAAAERRDPPRYRGKTVDLHGTNLFPEFAGLVTSYLVGHCAGCGNLYGGLPHRFFERIQVGFMSSHFPTRLFHTWIGGSAVPKLHLLTSEDMNERIGNVCMMCAMVEIFRLVIERAEVIAPLRFGTRIYIRLPNGTSFDDATFPVEVAFKDIDHVEYLVKRSTPFIDGFILRYMEE